MGIKISKNIMKFIFCIILMFLSVTKIYAYSSKYPGFNILILNSYHQGHYWESNILDGLNEYMKKNNELDVNFKVEYLDFRNKNDREYVSSLKEMLNEKYKNRSIDAIYTVDDEAYETFKGETFNKESSFYKIPLLFSGVDNKVGEKRHDKKYMSGIYHRDDTRSLFSLIKRLNPKTDTINLIIEDSLYCESFKAEIDNTINTFLNKEMKIRYIRSDYIQDVSKKLQNLKYEPNDVNIIAGEFQCKNSLKYLSPKRTIQKIKDYSQSPIYSNDQTYMNAGILGGCIDIGQEQGAIVGDMILKIKNGQGVFLIPNNVEPIAKEYIDYNSIYEYDISIFNISHKDNIINKKKYQLLLPVWIKTLIFIILALIIFIIILVFRGLIKCKKLQKQKEEDYNKAKERDKLKTDFIVNLSHELRTPINIILGTTKVLEINALNNNLNKVDIINKLENINQNSYRLLKISNNTIDITKAESGMFELKLKNCNIVDVVEEIFTASVEIANRKNLKMIFDTEQEEIITAIDIYQIQRVILNLLSNAIKFTNQNGCIKIQINKNKGSIIIEVKDNGVGIPEEKLNKIFYRFYQVDNLMTRKSEGSGIGLCIVKEIIEIHGGQIEVESKINSGTIFKVYLPIKIVEKEDDDENLKILDIKSIVKLEMSDV